MYNEMIAERERRLSEATMMLPVFIQSQIDKFKDTIKELKESRIARTEEKTCLMEYIVL